MAQQCHGWAKSQNRRCNKMSPTGFCHHHKECKVHNCGQHPPSATQTQNFPPENSLESSNPSLDEYTVQKILPESFSPISEVVTDYLVKQGGLVAFVVSANSHLGFLPHQVQFFLSLAVMLVNSRPALRNRWMDSCQFSTSRAMCTFLANILQIRIILLQFHLLAAAFGRESADVVAAAIGKVRGRYVRFGEALLQRMQERVRGAGGGADMMSLEMELFITKSEGYIVEYETEFTEAWYGAKRGLKQLQYNFVPPEMFNSFTKYFSIDASYYPTLPVREKVGGGQMAEGPLAIAEDPPWLLDLVEAAYAGLVPMDKVKQADIVADAMQFSRDEWRSMAEDFTTDVQGGIQALGDSSWSTHFELGGISGLYQLLIYLTAILFCRFASDTNERPRKNKQLEQDAETIRTG